MNAPPCPKCKGISWRIVARDSDRGDVYLCRYCGTIHFSTGEDPIVPLYVSSQENPETD